MCVYIEAHGSLSSITFFMVRHNNNKNEMTFCDHGIIAEEDEWNRVHCVTLHVHTCYSYVSSFIY